MFQLKREKTKSITELHDEPNKEILSKNMGTRPFP